MEPCNACERTWALGLRAFTSSHLCSFLSNDRNLCLYPCSSFSSSAIMTLQHGGEPEHQYNIILCAMTAYNAFNWEKLLILGRTDHRFYCVTLNFDTLVMCHAQKMRLWEPMLCSESEEPARIEWEPAPSFFPFAAYLKAELCFDWSAIASRPIRCEDMGSYHYVKTERGVKQGR